MSSAKLAVVCGLAALAISACGDTAKPRAGSVTVAAHPMYRGKVDDPRPTRLQCLKAHHIDAYNLPGSPPKIQIGGVGSGPLVVFLATPGTAQGAQIDGGTQAAEVIGAALLYPRNAPDKELGPIESCLAEGVKG
jgi:hypothetical protein